MRSAGLFLLLYARWLPEPLGVREALLAAGTMRTSLPSLMGMIAFAMRFGLDLRSPEFGPSRSQPDQT